MNDLFLHYIGWFGKSNKIDIAWTALHKIFISRIWRPVVYDTTRFSGLGRWTRTKTLVKLFLCMNYKITIIFLISARLKRRTLTADDINKIKDVTPTLKKGSSKMFRNLRDKGIISYTEYLFLLSILTSTITFYTQSKKYCTLLIFSTIFSRAKVRI